MKLPKKCECGGVMVYTHAFDQVFSYCKKCTPVVTMRPPQPRPCKGKIYYASDGHITRGYIRRGRKRR